VLGLNEPQVWTLIGVFSAIMVGVLGIVWSSFRSLGAGLRSEMQSFRNEMGFRLDSIGHRLDNLDRDVQFLMRKKFGDQ
jgi:hypothetical protein